MRQIKVLDKLFRQLLSDRLDLRFNQPDRLDPLRRVLGARQHRPAWRRSPTSFVHEARLRTLTVRSASSSSLT
eukprot:760162-Hanusia_phi.AAC.1